MTIKQSKLHNGKLTLGTGDDAINVECQATNVTISSTYNETGDAVVTLCGDGDAPSTSVTRSLKITAIQDFDDPDGLMVWLRDHELTTQAFSWQASPTSEVATGTVQVRLGDWGGDVAVRLTTELEMPIAGNVTWSPPPPPAPLSASAAESTPPAGDRRKVTVTYDNGGTGNGIKIVWKTGAVAENFPSATGTASHTYVSGDDGEVDITVTDLVVPSRTQALSQTIPYTP